MTSPKPGNHIQNRNKEITPVQPKKYVRKPFQVNAVQVTDANFEEVAAWCGGTIVTTRSPQDEKTEESERYIKVEVSRPLNERQTKAYVGDWLLQAAKGFKVYTDGPFTRNFALVTDEDTPQELMVTAEAARG